ncbi:MAG: hypothetical protein KUG59_00560 [Parvibaculaceae bacterium]|nr:hypothetical protein [Parvibaculaceae bacterium]
MMSVLGLNLNKISLLIVLFCIVALPGAAYAGRDLIEPAFMERAEKSSGGNEGGEDGIGGTGLNHPSTDDRLLPGQRPGKGVGVRPPTVRTKRPYVTLPGNQDNDIGVVGVITQLDQQIRVAGVLIDVSANSSVLLDTQPAHPDDLALGQFVRVQAVPVSGGYRARYISIERAVVGPVASVDVATSTFSVLGQTIRLIDPGVSDALPAVGDWVSASGLRDAHEFLVLTHLQMLEPRDAVRVRGVVDAVGEHYFQMSELLVPRSVLTDPSDIGMGDEVVIQGYILEGQFVAMDGVRQSRLAFNGRVVSLIYDGFVADAGDRFAGHSWRVGPGLGSVVTGSRLRFEATPTQSGRLEVVRRLALGAPLVAVMADAR